MRDSEVHARVRERRRRDGFIDGRLSVLDWRTLSIPGGYGLICRRRSGRTLVMWVRSVDADLFLECEAYHGQAFALTGTAPHKPRGGGRKGPRKDQLLDSKLFRKARRRPDRQRTWSLRSP